MSKFKVGDRVRVVKANRRNHLEVGDECVIWEDDGSPIPFRVLSDRPPPTGHDARRIWFRADELELISPTSEPSPPWAVLREAANVLYADVDWAETPEGLDYWDGVHGALRRQADRLEAAARQKPSTLSEAVDAFLAGGDLHALREAREREAGK